MSNRNRQLERNGKSYVAVPTKSSVTGAVAYNIHKWDPEAEMGVGAYLYTEGESFVAKHEVK